jgi:hypothetical protein
MVRPISSLLRTAYRLLLCLGCGYQPSNHALSIARVLKGFTRSLVRHCNGYVFTAIPEPVHQGASKCGLKLIASDSRVTARDLRYYPPQSPMGATVYISGNRSGMGCVFEYDNPKSLT